MLMYYYCSHGPGHQSHTDEFFEMHDDATDEDVQEFLEMKLDRYNDPVIHFWKVDSISQDFIDAKIKGMKNRINAYRISIKELEEQIVEYKQKTGIKVGNTDHYDKEVMLALTARYPESLMEILHKNGITVDSSVVWKWQRGISSPSPEIRDLVIACGKKAKRFLMRSCCGDVTTVETIKQSNEKIRKLVTKYIELIEKKKSNDDKDCP